MSTNVNDLHARFAALQQQYLDQLANKVAQIESLWSQWQSGSLTAGDLAQLQRIVHNLAGSGATFGLKEVSEAARALDVALQAWVNAADPMGERPDLVPLMDRLLTSLRERTLQSSVSITAEPAVHDAILIYVAGRNAEETAELTRQIAYLAMRPRVFCVAPMLWPPWNVNNPSSLFSMLICKKVRKVGSRPPLSCVIGMEKDCQLSLRPVPPILAYAWQRYELVDVAILLVPSILVI
jgi:Hpt domain.